MAKVDMNDPSIVKLLEKNGAAANKAQASAVKAESKRVTDLVNETMTSLIADLKNAGHADASKMVKSAHADLKTSIKAAA